MKRKMRLVGFNEERREFWKLVEWKNKVKEFSFQKQNVKKERGG